MTGRKELTEALGHPWMRVAIVLALIALIATAALGGFRKATARTGASQVPTYPAGTEIRTSAMAITALQAWRSLRDPDGISDPDKPEQYLVLRVRVENLTGKSNNAYGNLSQDVVWLVPGREGLDKLKADRFLRADDHTLIDELHPRMPTTVDLVWKLPPGQAVAAEQTWGVVHREFESKATFFGSSGWVQGGPAAKLRVPVEDRRAHVIEP